MRPFLILVLLGFFSCNKAKQSVQDGMNETIERAIENKTGSQIDLPDADEIENNAAWVSYRTEKKVYLSENEKLFAGVVFQKENDELSIAIQLTDEKGKSLMVIINHVPENFSLPLIGKFAVSNAYDGVNPVATLMFIDVTDEGMMNSEMLYQGEFKITKLTKDDIRFELLAKGGDVSDAPNPSNWYTITGKGTIMSPMIQSFGVDTNNVLK